MCLSHLGLASASCGRRMWSGSTAHGSLAYGGLLFGDGMSTGCRSAVMILSAASIMAGRNGLLAQSSASASAAQRLLSPHVLPKPIGSAPTSAIAAPPSSSPTSNDFLSW